MYVERFNPREEVNKLIKPYQLPETVVPHSTKQLANIIEKEGFTLSRTQIPP